MWVFLDGHKYTTTGTPYKMTHAAGEVYVTLSGRNVGVYHFFGQEDYTERLIDLSEFFTNDPYYICNGPNCVYVFEGVTSPNHDERLIKSFVKISTLTNEITQHVTLPQQAHCYPTYGRFKLWFTTPSVADITSTGRDNLFYFDTLTNKWSSLIEIPGNKQFRPRKIHWAKQSYIFVESHNENSVMKFNDNNGSFASQIIFNRAPTHMYTDGNRNLLVSSYNGMLTKIDQVLDTYSNDYATTALCSSFQTDGTYVWAVTPTLERTTLAKTGIPATHDSILMDGQNLDSSIVSFSETSFKDVILVPTYTHNEWDVDGETITEVTEEQQIVLLGTNSLFVATTLRDSWTLEEIRPYYLDVTVTAMIATGPEAYYGETT